MRATCTCRPKSSPGSYRFNHHLTSLIINAIQCTSTPLVADVPGLPLYAPLVFPPVPRVLPPNRSKRPFFPDHPIYPAWWLFIVPDNRFHRVLFRNDTALGSVNEPHRGKKERRRRILKRGTISSLNAHASEFTCILLCVFPIKLFEIQCQCSLASEGEEWNSERSALLYFVSRSIYCAGGSVQSGF